MSIRVDTSPLISSSLIVGESGHGVLAENIPSSGPNGAGYTYNDLSLPADNGKEIRGEVVTFPASGVFFAYEDTSFEFTAPDGTYFFEYQLYVDGVATGSPVQVDLVVGVGAIEATCAFSFANTFGGSKQAVFESSVSFDLDSDLGQGGNSNASSAATQALLSVMQSAANAISNVDAHFDITQDMQTVGGLLLEAATTYGIVGNISSNGDISIEAGAMYATSNDVTTINSADMQSSVSYSVVQNTLSQAIANALASGDIGIQSNLNAVSDMVVGSLAAVNIVSAYNAVAGLGFEANLSANIVNNLSSEYLKLVGADADFQNILSVLSSNIATMQAISLNNVSQNISITNTVAAFGGIDVTITTTYTAAGISISGSFTTPDSRTVNITVNSRVVSITTSR